MTKSLPQPVLEKDVGASKIAWLDSIRFLSALAVVVCHTRGGVFVEFGSLPEGQKNLATAGFYFLTRMGREAVLAFFVLSGYLVLGKTMERLLSGTYDGSRYVVDRVARVYPPLALALVISGIACAVCNQAVDVSAVAVNLLGLQGTGFVGMRNPPLWSLAYEMWFYALLWSAFCIVKHRVSLLSVGLLLASFWVFTKLDVVFLFCWVAGGLFYFYRPQASKVRVAASAALTGMLFVAIELTSESKSFPAKWEFVLSMFPGCTTCSLLGAVAFAWFVSELVVHRPTGAFVRWDSRIGWSSCFSYSLYLVHYPLIYIWEALVARPRAVMSIGSIGWWLLETLAVSIPALGVYYVTERQTPKIKGHIFKWIN